MNGLLKPNLKTNKGLLMNKVTVLIGNIGSGKSTWINKNHKDTIIISKDLTRRSFAKCVGKGYIFDDELEKYIHEITINFFKGCLYLGSEHIIYDETNMTKVTRQPFIEVAKNLSYSVHAVVLPDLGEEEHVRRRLSNNYDNTITKEKWIEIYQWKKNRFEEPSKEEGFDSIIYL